MLSLRLGGSAFKKFSKVSFLKSRTCRGNGPVWYNPNVARSENPNFPTPISPRVSGMEIAPGVRVEECNLRLQYARSSGPGGQNVNKVNTKTELWVPITAMQGLSLAAKTRLANLAGHRLTQMGEIHIAADNHRTQEANRNEAFDRLRELIIQAMHQPKVRRKTKISKGAKRRRVDDKKKRAVIKSNRKYSGE